MRVKIARLILQGLSLLFGISFTLGSIFAVQLGIDNDPGWGRGRIITFILGSLALVLFLLLTLHRQLGRLMAKIKTTAGWLAIAARLDRLGVSIDGRGSVRLADESRLNRRGLSYSYAGAAIVLISYFWYITAGTWGTWTPYSHYYDQLADGFLHGQLSLIEKPSAELLALAQPYDYHNREGIPVLWDASLYNGNYYLYFGPVPALFAALVKAIVPVVVEDQYLLLGFMAGFALAFTWLLWLIRKLFFSRSPAWPLFPLALLGGLALPMLWLINRPDVYETAIASGQCFLILGLALFLRGLAQPPARPVFLVLAGISWGLAANSRVDLAIEIILFVLLAVAWLAWIDKQSSLRKKIALLASLLVPLGIFAAGMAWYNFARFGSILETGHRYQLTGLSLPADYSLTTSLAYLVPNLYNYAFRPLLIHWHEFPFLFTPFLKQTSWPFFIQPPPNYVYAEPVSGLLLSTPAVLIGLAPLSGSLRRFTAWLHERPAPAGLVASRVLSWLVLLAGGGALLAFFTILIFIFSTMRYLADATPLLVVVAAIGWYWTAHQLRASPSHPYWRVLLHLAAVMLIVVSISISLLAAFQAPDQRFMANNPRLYAQIAAFFTR